MWRAGAPGARPGLQKVGNLICTASFSWISSITEKQCSATSASVCPSQRPGASRRQRGLVTRSFRLLSARITLRPRDLQPMPIRRISDIGTGAYSIETRVVMQIRLTVLELVDTYTLRRRRWSDRAAAIGLQADSRHKLLSVYQLLETTRTSMATPSMTIGFSQTLSTTPARWSSSRTTWALSGRLLLFRDGAGRTQVSQSSQVEV